MDGFEMESNKWLWQPKKNGPVYLRFSYRTLEGKLKTFVQSLETAYWPDARRIRDKVFLPLIKDIHLAEAQVKLAFQLFPDLEKKLRSARMRHPESGGKTAFTLEKLIGEWTAALRVKGGNYETAEATACRYEQIGRRFASFAGSKSVAELDAQVVVKYRDMRLEGDLTSKKTVDLELGALKRLFGFALDRSLVSGNPVVGVVVNRTRSEKNRENRLKKRRPPTHDEATKICTRFPSARRYSALDFQDYAIFARYTGMRQAEIGHLQVEDFVFLKPDEYADVALSSMRERSVQYANGEPEGMILCVYVRDEESRETKTGLERIVPVSEKLLPVVHRRLASIGKGPLFKCAWGGESATFGRTWLKKVKSIAPDLTMHGFRHYAASEMENNGAGANVSCAVLGHVPEKVHGGYLHISIKAMKDAVDKIF